MKKKIYLRGVVNSVMLDVLLNLRFGFVAILWLYRCTDKAPKSCSFPKESKLKQRPDKRGRQMCSSKKRTTNVSKCRAKKKTGRTGRWK